MRQSILTAWAVAALASTPLILACDPDASVASEGALSSISQVDPSGFSTSVASPSSSSYIAEDLASSHDFVDAGEVDLSAPAGAALASGVSLTVSGDECVIDSTVASPVRLTLRGSGQLSVKLSSASPIQVVLAGAHIAASRGAALGFTESSRAFVTLETGTDNSLSDSAASDAGQKAALYAKGPLIIGGGGSLSVTGALKHGIYSKDYVRITGGTIAIAVSARDGIRAVNGVVLDDGKLAILATGSTVDEEGKGIKVEGDDDSASGAGKGSIVINGGTISITSVSKAITAAWDADEDTGSYSGGDPDPDVIINSGYISIMTTGTPYEYVDPSGRTVSLSPEGIEAKSDLIINGGYITVASTDDALNAGSSITVNGGYVNAVSSQNDAIDSNGTIAINGGTVLAFSAAAPESGFDCDQNAFAVAGGTLLGAGGSTSAPTLAACSQPVLILYGLESLSDSLLAVKASSGDTVFASELPSIVGAIVVSSPSLSTGMYYSLIAGGAASTDSAFSGLGLGSLYHEGGSSVGSIQVSSMVASIGTAAGPNGR